MVTLDPTDSRILDELGRDCRISYQKLAGRVGLSTTAVIRRVSALIGDGTITNFVVIPSRKMTGATGFTAVVHTDGTEDVKEFVDLVGANRGIIQVSELADTKGGAYFITGSYIGSEHLRGIGKSFRDLEHVRDVELHTVTRMLVSEGTKVELTKHQLLVLRALRRDARLPVKEIASETGLSVKRVRKTLREIQESGAFRFTTRISHTVARGLDVVLRIQNNDNEMSNQEVWNWLNEEFPTRVFDVFQSATEPVLFAWFEPNDIREVYGICETVRQGPSIDSATPLVFLSSKKFPWLGELLLDEMIQEIE